MPTQKSTSIVPYEHENRRGPRFPVFLPVTLRWMEGSAPVEVEGEAHEVNTFGGVVRMRRCPAAGMEVEVVNHVSGVKARARVIRVLQTEDSGASNVALELLKPSDILWGVSFRLKKTSAELRELEEDRKSVV